jgi:hypothetical protein
MRILLFAIALSGCAPEEPAWQEGEVGEWQPGLTVGQAGGCSTFIVDGLSQQLIAEQNCIRAGALVSFAGATGISIGSNVYPYLETKARDGLEAAAKAHGINVTSAFRTLAQQYLLYRWYQNGQCGIGLAAVPGNSNHETGIAVDVSNYSAALSAMTNHGFTHSYPSSDPVHFDYTGGGTTDLRAESVLAFQKLWNLNHPNDPIAEDGAYGLQTGARVSQSPADGFALGSTCAAQSQPSNPPAPSNPPSSNPPSSNPSNPPMPSNSPSPNRSNSPMPSNPPSPPDYAAELSAQSDAPTLATLSSTKVWVEFRNIGAKPWTPGSTFLGTDNPRDRVSALLAPDWVSGNRPATVDHVTPPGDVGRFQFTIVAPPQAEALSESFGLVEEGVTWFDDVQFSLEVQVAPRPESASAAGGCSLGGTANASPSVSMLTIVIVGFLYGRRRRRDVR